jgi:hypothetical protein
MSKDTPDFRGDRLLSRSGDARQTIRASILWIDDEVDAGHPLGAAYHPEGIPCRYR